MFQQFSNRNENTLRNLGVEVNDYTKWLAHNLGAGNVKDFVEGKETPRLVSAISAQFGGKTSGIDEYNEKFGKFFKGERKTNTGMDTRNLVDEFDRKAPTSYEGDINSRYDKISSIIEPQLSKDTELTQNKKEELLNKYEPVLDKVREDIAENGDGILDRKRYFNTLVADKVTKNGVSVEDRKWANDIIDRLLAENRESESNPPNRVGGIGERGPSSVKDLFDRVPNKSDGSDVLESRNAPSLFSKGINAFLDRYENNYKESVERGNIRRMEIAAKYAENPGSLSASEQRWIRESMFTPQGRKELEAMGIPTK